MTASVAPARAPFVVVLGPDYAGKSSALAALLAADPWQVVSVDESLMSDEHMFVSRLRRQFLSDVLPVLGQSYSPDFLLAVLQTAVVHLRDQVVENCDRPLVVDSYYYKMLAKCRLLLGADHPVLAWWRTFPQPSAVLFLDVSASTAWRRSGHGARLNRLEHYGAAAGWADFAAYQRDLRRLMLDEVRHLPVRMIPENDGLAGAAQRIREELADALV